MVQFVYDGSFEGLLTAVFEVYAQRCTDARIVKQEEAQALLFGESREVASQQASARRVWTGLGKKLSPEALKNLYWCFLSELQGMEDTLLAFIRYALSSEVSIESDFGNAAVLLVAQTAKKVAREKHRFEAFVRFEEAGGGLYYAPIEPDYNVLPLIVPHFKRRFPAQNWLIYDTRRGYGMHYDAVLEQVMEVESGPEPAQAGAKSPDAKEEHYRGLWRTYFKSVNIASRKNLKLHLRHVPKRYWKYLTEKKDVLP